MRKAEGRDRERLESMAVSGADILTGIQKRAWGLEVPWRVRVIKVQGKKKEVEDELKEKIDLSRKKKKAGKKRRILIREKGRRAEEARRKREEGEKDKEEREKEKRTRRNREKKVKRKMKEKAKKAGGVDAVDTADVPMDGTVEMASDSG